MTRPLFLASLADLEAQIVRNVRNDAELALVEQELRKRTTKRAKALLDQVRRLRQETAEPPASKAAAPLKYARVHAAATAAGSPTVIGWQHAARSFVPGDDETGSGDSVYNTIRILCREAGPAGITGAALATALRQRQIGNRKSVYCDGLPPIGWAEGWIDTAVTKDIIAACHATRQRQDLPAKRSLRPTAATIPTPTPRKPPPMTDARRWTEQAVAALRTKLIDLGKKNPLISFKHGGRSATILRIVDERPDLLVEAIDAGAVGFDPLPGEDETPKDETTQGFQIAYERARLTDETFLAATDKLGDNERDARAWQEAERALRVAVRASLGLPPLEYGKTIDVTAIARAHGFDPSYYLRNSDDGEVAAHHQDDKVRVLLTAKELDKRLKSIAEKYGSHKRETGLHTLFLVLGFVQWYEDVAPDTALHAPLLLLDVDLIRKPVGGRYVSTLVAGQDGLQVNVALAEKMRQHWGLELPALRDEETPESYFIRVDAVLAKGTRLSLRRFATLAVLPFPRMVLWKDLDPAAWPEAAFAAHRLLPGLLGASAVDGETQMATTIDIDSPEWADAAPALIRPADASQHSALIDMAAGHDLAIEGPPGTGKSETITNMIATALGAGKRVLFVAEKQAALRVVADRMRASGFGALLLELHGDNANRTLVYDGLRDRLKATARVDAPALQSKRYQLKQQRELLRRYLALIGADLGALGRTTYWLMWREMRLRDTLDAEAMRRIAAGWTPASARTVDQALLAERRGRLETFATALLALDRDAVGGERTRWTLAKQIDPFDQGRQLDAASLAAQAASAMHQAAGAIEALVSLAMPQPGGLLSKTTTQLFALEPFEPIDEAIACSALRAPDTARSLLRQQARWRQLDARLGEDVVAPTLVGAADVVALGEAIASFVSLPPTVALARARLNDVRTAIAALRASDADRRSLVGDLGLSEAASADALRDTLVVIAALAAEPPIVAALYRDDLLDPLAETALFAERARAATLRDERAAISGSVSTEAVESDPAELAQIADTLEQSGLFARLFGGEYKAAQRRAARLVEDASDRMVTADMLRRLTRVQGRIAGFRNDSAVAAWFPAILWKGVDADWDAIQRARAVLLDARRGFGDAGADVALRRWLALTPDERGQMAGCAARLASVVVKVAGLGLGALPFAGIEQTLVEHETSLAALDSALDRVGVRPEGRILVDGEDLAIRLGTLQAASAAFADLASREMFGWVAGIDAGLEPLARTLDQADRLRATEGPLAIVPALIDSDTPTALLSAIIERRADWLTAESGWQNAAANLHASAQLDHSHIATSWHELASGLAAMASDATGVRLAADLQKYGRALDEAGLASLGAVARDGMVPPDRLPDIYELLLIQRLLAEYLGSDGAELGRIGGLTLDAAREAFTRIDKELHALEARAIVAQRLGDKPPQGVGHGPKSQHSEMELLRGELELKRPRTPIRDVVHRAGGAMQVLKPVWMMSPTSAAQYIRPDTLTFDLLVVDEASQMRPEFALSAILRGAQFVVVGDANQLPPSDHFQTATDAAEDGEDSAGVSMDTESILDLANQKFRRKRRLKWHYRSQHESLIQFSNREFYQNDLVVFPSPMGRDDDLLGVKCRYVTGAVYDASINQREAEAVIEEAFRLMRAYPQHSIGIAAMNAKQTELIQNEFDRLILEQPEIRRYVQEYLGGVDEFFIKNLENVQGDERDIILISTVYGPGKDGNVRQNFGLMNREVGWRRLNVLVTRAKLSTRLFTSLRPDDVKVTPTSSRGVRTLKAYLTYAHHGAGYDDASGGDPDSDFEVFVADALRAAGYEVVHQVGVEGFRIDLGIRHPDYPVGFIAGIECDGASFHSGLTVRDRDRIRQTVLENMGWRIYRIWSTDWFADPNREMAKVLGWLGQKRAEFAEDYINRPQPVQGTSSTGPDPDPQTISPTAPATLSVAPPLPVASSDRSQPTGRQMRSLDHIDWYEVSKGHLYEIWSDDTFLGEVEVLSRATAAPRVYGSQLVIARSEYEGWVATSDTRFKTNDIHAAVRELARRAQAADAASMT
ncbi:DUF4011 domain-containing protein [Sphingomonas aurantiaca]